MSQNMETLFNFKKRVCNFFIGITRTRKMFGKNGLKCMSKSGLDRLDEWMDWMDDPALSFNAQVATVIDMNGFKVKGKKI